MPTSKALFGMGAEVDSQLSHTSKIVYFIKLDNGLNIPNAISKRLTNISCNKNVFEKNVDVYQAALKIVALMEK